MGGETRVSIGDYSLGEHKPWVQVTIVELGDLWSQDCAQAEEEDGRPQAPMVNNGKHAIVPSALG